MAFYDMFQASSISASGMAAERFRMEVIAHNIANAQTTRSSRGGPYRRLDVVFEEVLRRPQRAGEAPALGGVRAAELVEDPTEPIRLYMPGHPDADENGYVAFPNVQLPIEMVNHPNVLDYDFKLHVKDEIGKIRGRERVLAFLERYKLTFSHFVGYVTQPAYRDVLTHTGIVLLPKQPRKRQNNPEALKELITWIKEQMDH